LRLALGTAQFGLKYGLANPREEMSKKEASKIIQYARFSKIELIDTAIAYGSSEEVLGTIGVDGFKVVTKLPPIPEKIDDVHSWILKQVTQSLSRLGIQSLYGLLLHRSEDLLGKHGVELTKSLKVIKLCGLVEKIGVSIYDPVDLAKLIKVMRLDIVQAPVNLIDRRLEHSNWMQRLYSEGIEIHARSIFLQGLLLLPQKKIPDKFSRWSYLWSSWHEELKNKGVSQLAACLSYPLSLKEIDRVIIGIDCLNQLKQLIICTNTNQPLEDWGFMISEDKSLINPANWHELSN